jgi:hypothetical protein
MQQRDIARHAVIGALLMSSASCADKIPTVSSTGLMAAPKIANIEYSAGFYPDGNGGYYWDGQPAPGDIPQADIYEARTFSKAPEITDGGWKTSGFVKGEIWYYGDQANIKIVYSVTKDGRPLYTNAEAESGWRWGPLLGGDQHDDFYVELYSPDFCNIGVSAGGTAFAAMAVPFRITLNFLRPTSPGITLGAFRWGHARKEMLASADPGKACPPAPCDDPRTEIVEACSPDNPPAGTNPNWSQGGLEEKQIDVAGDTFTVRCWYIDHFWGDVYLGRTWLWCERI